MPGKAGLREPSTEAPAEAEPSRQKAPVTVPTPIDGRYDLAGWYLMGRIFRLRRSLPRARPRLVDLGMGRGRDILYFVRRGFKVLGIDSAPEAVRRAVRRAARLGVRIETRTQDLRTYRLHGTFDVVYSSCFLNNLPPAVRRRRFADFHAATSPGGIHAVNAFLREPAHAASGEEAPGASPFRRGELRRYYQGWEILESGVVPFKCLGPGPVHRHAVDVLIARKPAPRAPSVDP